MKNYNHYEIEDFLIDETFADWVRGVQNESSEEWEEWLRQNPFKQPLVHEAQILFQSIQVKPGHDIEDHEVENMIFDMQQRIQPPRRIVRWPMIRVAAGLFFMVSVGVAVGVYLKKSDRATSAYQYLVSTSSQPLIERKNTTGASIFVHLPDHSSVVLKPGARISFDPAFKGQQRVVYLEGEAFFEVTKNPDRPFYVYANDLVTKVLGTSFVINAEPGGEKASVAVMTGRVSVFSRNGHETKVTKHAEQLAVVLTPNQQVEHHCGDSRLLKGIVTKPQLIQKSDQVSTFDFSDSSLTEVFAKLEKAYGVRIIYDEETMAKCPLTASFTNRPLFEMLTIICKAVEARYEVLDGQIIVYGRGC
ncbi:FecR family protein [Siphonobacter sp. SORGH_AS_0500]|uniref:FecR family protein n=1 Tax=Siphonobacter sp. SORGH_AS_0500 TaxID=1864824 RepID=UPI00285AD39F|nr:FecR family protein [Siphonobacter sp. SORGH_AS_0500]MDR6194990.1 transmembrane sensor [Siphonobacter sp. SORGH_AS_0500]